MTTDELLATMKELGLEVLADPGGRPVVMGKVPAVLLPVLKYHRKELLRRLGLPPDTPPPPEPPQAVEDWMTKSAFPPDEFMKTQK